MRRVGEPPLSGAALLARARALADASQPAAAEVAYRKALAAFPEQPEILRQLGILNVRLGRLAPARGFLAQSVAATPRPETLLLLAGVCTRQDDHAAAEAACVQAIALAPADAAARLELANVKLAVRDYAAAELHLREALERDPGLYAARRNLGPALCAQGQFAAAATALTDALRLQPGDALSWKNLGTAQRGRGLHRQAAESYRTAIAHAPEFAEAHRDLGLSLMLQGHYAEGLAEYEWRHRAQVRGAENLPGVRWRGETLRGTLLVHFEQGLGDTLQFLRFVPAAAALVGRLVLCVQRPVARLAEGLAPNLDLIVHGARLPRYDACAYLLSLPLLLGTNSLERLPPPRLASPPPSDTDHAGGLRVGIVWAGSPTHEDDRQRSIDPDLLAPLLTMPGVEWLALQPGAALPRGIAAPPPPRDLADTAALIGGLDLLISVDTAAAHLAGALGRPVWTLLAAVPDWRWGIEGEATPWYPSMRLYRQPARGDWASVIDHVRRDLQARHGVTHPPAGAWRVS